MAIPFALSFLSGLARGGGDVRGRHDIAELSRLRDEENQKFQRQEHLDYQKFLKERDEANRYEDLPIEMLPQSMRPPGALPGSTQRIPKNAINLYGQMAQQEQERRGVKRLAEMLRGKRGALVPQSPEPSGPPSIGAQDVSMRQEAPDDEGAQLAALLESGDVPPAYAQKLIEQYQQKRALLEGIAAISNLPGGGSESDGTWGIESTGDDGGLGAQYTPTADQGDVVIGEAPGEGALRTPQTEEELRGLRKGGARRFGGLTPSKIEVGGKTGVKMTMGRAPDPMRNDRAYAADMAFPGSQWDELTPAQKKVAEQRYYQTLRERAGVKTQADRAAGRGQTGRLLGNIKDLADHLIVAETPLDAAKQGAMLTAGAFSGSNELAATYQDMLDSFQGVLARSLAAEKGTLTDRDIARITRAFPTFRQTKQIKDLKFAFLQDLFDAVYDPNSTGGHLRALIYKVEQAGAAPAAPTGPPAGFTPKAR